MIRRGVLAVVLAGLLALGWFAGGWFQSGPLKQDTPLIVAEGSSLSALAQQLEDKGAVASASAFKLRARVFGAGRTIKAGEFLLPKGASPSRILAVVTGDEVIRRFVTVPEGMPSIMVYERLMAQPNLSGTIAVPAEGTILPDTYEFERGESRQAVLDRMQAAMVRTVDALWKKRGPQIAVATPREALILASIVEKETGKPSERAMVAGLYSNRLRQGIMLQADPTIIYPITQGKPLGRRIRQSEIRSVNGYNTYAMIGLPDGPITNPGRASIEAVLHPANTGALYMVADGTGGHAFASTLAEHNANVQKWFALRRAKGEI